MSEHVLAKVLSTQIVLLLCCCLVCLIMTFPASRGGAPLNAADHVGMCSVGLGMIILASIPFTIIALIWVQL